jgi:hypothetical protein
MSGGYNRMLSMLAGHPVHHSDGTGPSRPTPGMSRAQAELDQIYKDNPPGSEGYKAASVQKRITELTERLHGGESVVGTNGRTS